MEISISFDYSRLLHNRITEFAGMYLMYLKDPKLADEKLPKDEIRLLHFYGKGSLLYLTAIAFVYSIISRIKGRLVQPEL